MKVCWLLVEADLSCRKTWEADRSAGRFLLLQGLSCALQLISSSFPDPSLTVRADITGRYSNRLYAYEPSDISLCK